MQPKQNWAFHSFNVMTNEYRYTTSNHVEWVCQIQFLHALFTEANKSKIESYCTLSGYLELYLRIKPKKLKDWLKKTTL